MQVHNHCARVPYSSVLVRASGGNVSATTIAVAPVLRLAIVVR